MAVADNGFTPVFRVL